LVAISGNDHRWTEKWPKAFGLSSWSKSFDYKNEADWKLKLELVHEHAWRTWKKIKDHDSMRPFRDQLKLCEGQVEQQGGVLVPQLIENLRPQFERMPPKKKY
jgi:hypothetical protein